MYENFPVHISGRQVDIKSQIIAIQHESGDCAHHSLTSSFIALELMPSTSIRLKTACNIHGSANPPPTKVSVQGLGGFRVLIWARLFDCVHRVQRVGLKGLNLLNTQCPALSVDPKLMRKLGGRGRVR